MNLAANRFWLGIKPSHFRFHSMASSLPRLYCARHFGITFVAARPRNFRTCGIFSNIQTDRKAQYFNVLKLFPRHRESRVAISPLLHLHHHSSRQRETYIPRNKNGTVRLDLSLSGLLFRRISNRSFFSTRRK